MHIALAPFQSIAHHPLPMPELFRLGLQVVEDELLGAIQTHGVDGCADGKSGRTVQLSGSPAKRFVKIHVVTAPGKVWLRFRPRSC